MRILVFPSAGHFNNLGDVAMLQIALARLRKTCPAARLQVLTDEPQSLKVYCPEAGPVEFRSWRRWSKVGALPGGRSQIFAPWKRSRVVGVVQSQQALGFVVNGEYAANSLRALALGPAQGSC